MPVPVRSPLSGHTYSAVELTETHDAVWMLDQRRLPLEEHYERIESAADVARGIREMVVRGAPAIGIAAAYGMALAARAGEDLAQAADVLRRARPTAVNLAWAVDRMLARDRTLHGRSAADRAEELMQEALAVHREDVAACRRMGELGAAWIPDGATVLTHCNAGALATGGWGTALGVIRSARAAGKSVRVLADETRPYLQGARLTTWELSRDGIPVELLTDGMAGHYFQRGEIAVVVVGSDRVAANGDVANKIGTYGVACLARLHERPFVVAAPWSTVDAATPHGNAIPIEHRSSDEVTMVNGRRIAPEGVFARHPGFDVTPARLVTALVTERGVLSPPDAAGITAMGSRAFRA